MDGSCLDCTVIFDASRSGGKCIWFRLADKKLIFVRFELSALGVEKLLSKSNYIFPNKWNIDVYFFVLFHTTVIPIP